MCASKTTRSRGNDRLGELHGVPSKPRQYLERRALLDGLKARLERGRGKAVGITSAPTVGVYGMGGIGKTVLAAALAHEDDVRGRFPDGIFWLTFG